VPSTISPPTQDSAASAVADNKPVPKRVSVQDKTTKATVAGQKGRVLSKSVPSTISPPTQDSAASAVADNKPVPKRVSVQDKTTKASEAGRKDKVETDTKEAFKTPTSPNSYLPTSNTKHNK
jgi:hypothetical protein